MYPEKVLLGVCYCNERDVTSFLDYYTQFTDFLDMFGILTCTFNDKTNVINGTKNCSMKLCTGTQDQLDTKLTRHHEK